MKKTVICSVAFAFAFSLALAGSALANAKGPAEITIKTEAGKKPAKFPHAKHQGKNECADCHKSDKYPADKKWSMKNGHDFCQGCHKEKGAPVTCATCHK